MRALAALAMRGPYHAAGLTALLGMLSWVLPFPHFSGAVVALVSLAQGGGAALRVLALAAVPVLAAAFALFGSAAPVVVLGLWWLGSLGFGLLLRARADEGEMLALMGLVALMGAAALRLLSGDVVAFWSVLLEQALGLIGEEGGLATGPELLAEAAALMTSVLAAGYVVNMMLTLLLARWWQSLLYNPGGFGREFRELRLPSGPGAALGAVGLVALVLAFTGGAGGGPAADFLAVAVVLLVFVGLAVAHHEVHRRGWPKVVLVGVYALLFLLRGGGALLIASLAVADALLDIRGLRRARKGGGDE